MISSHSKLFRLPLNLLFNEVFNYMAAMRDVTNRLNLTCRKMIMAFCNARVSDNERKITNGSACVLKDSVVTKMSNMSDNWGTDRFLPAKSDKIDGQ